ncbi:ABC transporter [Halobacteriales archaeon QS_3_64_16]|nr:MAG: ABC transporter [Halobacteriales archaeon QS_3_64_16]
MTPEFESEKSYRATVDSVDDGDTLNVTFADGSTGELRVIGVDTPETPANERFERTQEWEGITDLEYLTDWGTNASRFAKNELVGREVRASFDPNEPIRDEFDRLLAYVEYGRPPADGTASPKGEGPGSETDNGEPNDGTESGPATGNDRGERALYNRVLIEAGYARVYGSGFERHDELWRAEQAARAAGRGVWAKSNIETVPEIRDRPVEELFFPGAVSVETDTGPIDGSRVPVVAEPSATRAEPEGATESDEEKGEERSANGSDESNGEADETIALVGIDASANVALIGGLLVDEAYEASEGFAVDTSGYGNFPFVTNCIDALTDRAGEVLIDGGHGQFDAEYALSAEEMAYYKRYLEGQDIGLEQHNDLLEEFLDRGRALLLTPPPEPFTEEEQALLAAFAERGGAVVLLGSADASASAREHLNELASALGSDLRVGPGVRDSERNLDDDRSLPVTSAFDASFGLFSAYTPGDGNGDRGPGPGTSPGRSPDPDPGPDRPSQDAALAVEEIAPDAPGDERANLAEESITLANRGERTVALAGWSVEDEANHVYEFPDGFELAPGQRVTIHTGEGSDSASDLYWGSGNPIWNNSGDTIVLRDREGTVRARRSY